MLNDEEIKERADFKAVVILGELVSINPIMTQWFKNGYMLGYTQAQETIPSECIAFAEWFYNKVWRDHKNETWTMYGAGAKPFTAEQLFNVYLQEQTQK